MLKSDGLKLEDTQVEAAERLFKLAALGLPSISELESDSGSLEIEVRRLIE